MTLQQLNYAVAVAEVGNITETAKKLYISQPSLTASIHELEKELDITIFNRTNKGVTVTSDGDLFLSYARQIVEQTHLLSDRFIHKKERRCKFSVSCQHYSFAVNAFVDVIKEFEGEQYDFVLRETQTHEILEDVRNLKSEIGVLYLSKSNGEVLKKFMKQYDLEFRLLFEAKPHVFISFDHPLAKQDGISLEDLEEYPYLSFEQGEYNSFYFSEEILSSFDRKKNIKVRDRATLFNLLVGLKGYTVCSGVISEELNGNKIISRPLMVDEIMKIGVIVHKNMPLSCYALKYLEALAEHIK